MTSVKLFRRAPNGSAFDQTVGVASSTAQLKVWLA